MSRRKKAGSSQDRTRSSPITGEPIRERISSPDIRGSSDMKRRRVPSGGKYTARFCGVDVLTPGRDFRAKMQFLGVYINVLPPASDDCFLFELASARNRPCGGRMLFTETRAGFLRENAISRCIYPFCASVSFRQLLYVTSLSSSPLRGIAYAEERLFTDACAGFLREDAISMCTYPFS